MPCYIDLYTNPSDLENLERILVKAKRLGYCVIGVDDDLRIRYGLEEVDTSNVNVRIVWITLIEASTRREAYKKLASKKRVKKNLAIVKPKGIDAARYAGTSKKLAGLLVEPGGERFVDRSTSILFRERGWGTVIVPLLPLTSIPKSRKIWRFYYLVFRRAYAYGINLSLASGARNPGELWHPYSAAGVASLFGIPGEYSRTWLSSSPSTLLDKLDLF